MSAEPRITQLWFALIELNVLVVVDQDEVPVPALPFQ